RLLGISKTIPRTTLWNSAKMLARETRKALLKASLVCRNEGSALVDATGASANQYARWAADKVKKAKQYRKAHVAVGGHSRQFIAFRVTRGTRHDSKEFRRLHEQARVNAAFSAVKGDGGYASRNNAQLVEDAGQTPFLKPAKNVTLKSKCRPAWRRMVKAFREHEVEWLAEYHERSQVESVFSAFKRVFGAVIRAKRWLRQRVELELRAFVYNVYAAIQYR
ncbi:MAG: transposase, partial [Candidatus Micrarchaeia archaeon]